MGHLFLNPSSNTGIRVARGSSRTRTRCSSVPLDTRGCSYAGSFKLFQPDILVLARVRKVWPNLLKGGQAAGREDPSSSTAGSPRDLLKNRRSGPSRAEDLPEPWTYLLPTSRTKKLEQLGIDSGRLRVGATSVRPSHLPDFTADRTGGLRDGHSMNGEESRLARSTERGKRRLLGRPSPRSKKGHLRFLLDPGA